MLLPMLEVEVEVEELAQEIKIAFEQYLEQYKVATTVILVVEPASFTVRISRPVDAVDELIVQQHHLALQSVLKNVLTEMELRP